MKLKEITLFFSIIFLSFSTFAQDYQKEISTIENQIQKLDAKKDSLDSLAKNIRLTILHNKLKKYGLPKYSGDVEIVEHPAIILSYNEKYEQANWVAHIISKEITGKGFSRTNDFRPDPLVKTGSTEEKDFFLKHLNSDSSYTYDGFGYDRGHLAPSADFRWNKEAMSESYFYSNMSPQLPDFNRGIWARVESFLREYVAENKHDLYVVTGGILTDNLPKVKRSIHKVSIPKELYKVAVDLEGNIPEGIAFLVPNEGSDYPVISFAVPIDSVEKITGINFFASLPDSIQDKFEKTTDIHHWQTKNRKNNRKPINRNKLPKEAINTVMARSYYDNKAKVCGTVVEVHETKSGNYFLNFDQDFPEQLFWCTIWKRNIVNFSYSPKEYLINKKICVSGTVKKKYGKPSMSIYNEKQITLYKDDMKKHKK
ncbi:MAG: DNA/RNA non-specific endonuclease [Bacteroidales bacterium]|nr:DNA/RNA non-specific endonuclease [Bacteroidales bacterium]